MTQQYREVKRKAAVGERIKVVAIYPTSLKVGSVVVGDEFTVKSVDGTGDVWEVAERTFRGIISADWEGLREYVVLEPVTSAPSPLQSDPLYAAFRQFVVANAAEIRAILPEVEAKVSSTLPPLRMIMPGDGHLVITPERGLTIVPALTRAQVIAKATADVAELLTHNYPEINGGEGAWFSKKNDPFISVTDRVEFVVNRDKRTVTALLRYVDGNKVWRKATAKCSPADVFHADLGKAIALRKALGLTVPTEYTDAPQPEELGTGTVVHLRVSNSRYEVRGRCPEKDRMFNIGLAYWLNDGWDGADNFVKIDDTDVDYGAVKTEGAAA
ncbi:hypothetical protein [Paenibacillus sp. Marseille-Q9583]